MARLRLTIRNEHGHGRLTPWLVERLLTTIQGELQATMVTLESEHDAFCEGLDLDTLTHPATSAGEALERFATLLRAIGTAPRPVIALVGGPAVGGGVGLAAAADLVLATPRATFGLPEAMLGLIPAVVFPVLAQRVGVARARSLALGAAALSAEEAWRIGLVDEVVDHPEEAAARLERRFACMDARALAEVKALAAGYAGDGGYDRARAFAGFERLLLSAETRARLSRFVAGEAPWPTDVPP